MEKEVIDQLEKSYGKEFEEEYPFFKDQRYRPYKIDKGNFSKIKDSNSDNKICFIDGGNAEIISGPNISLCFIRIYLTIYQNNKRIKNKKFEFYLLVNAERNNDSITFNTKIFDNRIGLTDFKFDIEDETLKNGIQKVEISSIGGVIRRFSEIKCAELILDDLNKGSIIARDGSLQSSVTFESEIYNNLYKKAIQKEVDIIGLSKTTRMLTNEGNSLPFALSKFYINDEWYYRPVADINNPNHKSDLYFVRLNKKSQHIFRLDIFNGHNYSIENIMSILKQNSNDHVFLGYPYGFIEADKASRISNYEKEFMKTKILRRLNNQQRLFTILNTLNSHNILDNIY